MEILCWNFFQIRYKILEKILCSVMSIVDKGMRFELKGSGSRKDVSKMKELGPLEGMFLR